MPRPRDKLFQFDGLADFLHFLDWACSLANTQERLARMAYDFCERLQSDETGYADVIINPTHWNAWRGRTKAMIEALDHGFASSDGQLQPVGLCVSLLRTQTADEAIDLVEQLIEWRIPRVVALSIDGNEAAAGRTGPRFAEAFRRAGAAGLKRTVHAGQSSGPEGVRDAIDLLGADRIDHGVRAIEDDALVAVLADRVIPLSVCPTSNIALKVYPSMEAHPSIDCAAQGCGFQSTLTIQVYLERTCPKNTRSPGRRIVGPTTSCATSRARRSRPASPGQNQGEAAREIERVADSFANIQRITSLTMC